MAWLEVVKGTGLGKRFPLEADFLIGRWPSNSFCLPDTLASRQHAAVHRQENQHVLTDLGSSNGTLLNGRQIPVRSATPLRDGDLIQIGSTVFAFHTTPPPVHTASLSMRSRTTFSAPTQSGARVVIHAKDDAPPERVQASIDASARPEMIAVEMQPAEQLRVSVARLQAMVRVAADLAQVMEREALIARIMASLFDIFPGADRALILLPDERGELARAATRSRISPEDTPMIINSMLINRVIAGREAVLSSDTGHTAGTGLRSLMCAPLMCKDEMMGVITVDTAATSPPFTRDDLELLAGIAAQCGVALKNADLAQTVEAEAQKRAQLSRYMSPDLATAIAEGRVIADLGGKRAHGTVFFGDIVGFTHMSETMHPVQIIDKLNRYFRITTGIVARENGTIDKFGGDKIMAHWNVMFPHPSPEASAIKSGVEMQAAVWAFDLELIAENQQPIYLGIGMNTGELAAGNIGGQRIEYTVIGDTVNLGERIESMAGRWQVFVSESTYAATRGLCVAIGLPPIAVKGKSHPVKIYSVRAIGSPAGSPLMACIPARLLLPGAGPVEALITEIRADDASPSLALSTMEQLHPGSPVALNIEIPELAKSLAIRGHVSASLHDRHIGSVSYTRATLDRLELDAAARAFLSAGYLTESTKTWDEMKRR